MKITFFSLLQLLQNYQALKRWLQNYL